METVTILGAGHQGLAMAAHLGANGVRCFLWNRSNAGIEHIAKTHSVISHGEVEGMVKVDRASTSIEETISKLILVATPSTAHRDIAQMLAPLVDSSYIVILNPGRTLGAIDFAETLESYGCTDLPLIAEAQTIIYTCRRDGDNSVHIFALKSGIPIASLYAADTDRIIEALPSCIRGRFVPSPSMVETSLGNVGMVLHCAPTLMNIGWIENEKSSFEYYYDGISPTIANLIEQLDQERLKVAGTLGNPVESVSDWLRRTYGARGRTLYERLQNNEYYRGIDAPQSVHHRYIEEDVPNGLVPLESIGLELGIETPVTSTVISFASLVMGADYRLTGRRIDGFGKAGLVSGSRSVLELIRSTCPGR